MDIQPIDYGSTAIGRITQQHGNKPKFVALVEGLAQLVESDLENPAAELFNILNIDLMAGHNLDVIGDIVGQPRVLVDFDLLEFFGFDGAPASGTFGNTTDPNVGERFISISEDGLGGQTTLSDPEYRLFIKAKILKNYSTSTESDLADAIKLLLNVDQVMITEGVMSLDIGVLGTLSATQIGILQNYDILPRPTGVEIASVTEYGLLEFNGSSTQINITPAISDIDGVTTGSISGSFKSYSGAGDLIRMLEDAGGHLSIGMSDYGLAFSLNEGGVPIVAFKTVDTLIDAFFKFEVYFSPSGNGVKINGVDAEVEYTTGSATTAVDISTNYLNAFIGSNGFNGIIHGVKYVNAGTRTAIFDLVEGTGTTATDTSGNGNDGTITDPVWVQTLD